MKTLDPKMKEMMQRLMSRPEMMSADDMEVQPESIDDAEASEVKEPAVESDEEYVLPEETKQMTDDLTTDTNGMVANLPNKTYQGDPKITEMLRKLKAGQPVTDDTEVTPEIIEDPSASPDLRKAALEKVKQKYLGR